MNDNLKFWFALNKVEGLGPVKLKKLLDQYGSAKAACEALRCPPVDLAEEEAKLAAAQAAAWTIEDEHYPANLKTIHDPPTILFHKGKLTDFDQSAIAIVGTRNATRYGLETARKFAAQLADMGITVVSGLALGIDTAAHEGVLEAKGKTIAVLGSGIDQIYPRSNLGLAKRIMEQGALVSEFPLGQEPDTWTFPQRNRIISGLSIGVIMVEGHYDSGAMITAKLALDQGREVFAVPGQIGFEQSKGPHWLIKQGAKLIENVEDVLDELKFQIPSSKLQTTNKTQTTKDKPDNLTPEEEAVYKVIANEPKHLDMIALETGLPVPQISSLLMMLEIKKAIRQLPGKMFVLY